MANVYEIEIIGLAQRGLAIIDAKTGKVIGAGANASTSTLGQDAE